MKTPTTKMNPHFATSSFQVGAKPSKNRTQHLSDRVLSTREHWSGNEREKRAKLARIRQAELLSLLTAPSDEPEIWAVGAATTADVARMDN